MNSPTQEQYRTMIQECQDKRAAHLKKAGAYRELAQAESSEAALLEKKIKRLQQCAGSAAV